MRQIRQLNEFLSRCPANARVSLRLIVALRCESAEQQPFITPPFYHLSRAYGVIFLQTLRIYPILHNHNKYIPFSLLLAELMALTVCICVRNEYTVLLQVACGGWNYWFWGGNALLLFGHSLSAAGEEPMMKIIKGSL